MSNSLYLEAINAAEQLKFSAEEKAKQQLIESMSPQIKLLVEKKLMGDDKEEESVEYNLESEEESLDNENQECGVYDSVENESVNEINLDEDSRRILSTFITAKAKKEAISEKISELKEGLNIIRKAALLAENAKNSSGSKKKINTLFKKIVQEISNIKNKKIVRNNKQILKEYYELIKELNNMSRRRNRLIEESLEDLLEMNLFEEEGDDDGDDDEKASDDFDLDLGPDDEGDDDGDDDDDMSPPDSSDVSGKTTVEELAMMAGLLEDEGDDEGTEELDLEGLFEDDSDDESAYETMNAGEDDEGENCGPDEMAESFGRRDRVLEIDENMLRREIGRMKSIREGEAKDMASHFGGGSLSGEVFVDGVELNKLHEMKIKAAKVVRKNRMLESKLTQYKKALRGMKSQLTEMNLFNAKLLYANKLMQNRDLSIKQQRNIVESLDEAKTLGEAKILFESLSKSLVSRKTQRSNNLSEGAIRRRTGSSSAPVRSAQTLKESASLDRWATLAGIKK